MDQCLKRLSEDLKLSSESRMAIRDAIASQSVTGEDNSMKQKAVHFRTLLTAAALAVAMTITVSAAALLGAFDFIKKQDAFSLLGMTEVYEKYAYDVGLSATTQRGDVFTLEKAATDAHFCTIFYTYHYAEPQMTQAEFERMDGNSPWAAYSWTPEMGLFLMNGERVSAEGYNNSFELQQYFSDPSTVCGAWRCLLTAPFWEFADGAELELRGEVWDEETRTWESFSLVFPSHPCSMSLNTPDVTFSMYQGGKAMEIEVYSLSCSPLGNLLTLRYEKDPNNALGLDGSFALRNKDTGAYIPFARIWTMRGSDSAGMETDTYELFGNVNGLEALELVPVWYSGGPATRTTVPLTALPCTDPAVTNGGYAPTSYRTTEDGRLLVEMAPIGAVTSHYSSIGNGVGFLDKDGNELFKRYNVEKFKDRTTGIITVVTTVEDPEDFAANVDEVAALWFFTNKNTLLEDKAVTIPLPLSLEED